MTFTKGCDRSGEKNAMYGRHHSPEAKAKMSLAKRGKKLTPEHRLKISIGGKGLKRSPETRAKMSGKNNHNYGKMPSENFIKSACHPLEKNGRWLGGISYEPYCPKFNKDLKERIRAFFEYQCVLCGKPESEQKRKLSCHHVEYNKSACCDGKPVHFAAMCGKCHIKTNLERDRWESMIHRIIDEIYDGRSYFTKDEYRQMMV